MQELQVGGGGVEGGWLGLRPGAFGPGQQPACGFECAVFGNGAAGVSADQKSRRQKKKETRQETNKHTHTQQTNEHTHNYNNMTTNTNNNKTDARAARRSCASWPATRMMPRCRSSWSSAAAATCSSCPRCGLDWIGLWGRGGLDWTGLDWSGLNDLDWTAGITRNTPHTITNKKHTIKTPQHQTGLRQPARARRRLDRPRGRQGRRGVPRAVHPARRHQGVSEARREAGGF